MKLRILHITTSFLYYGIIVFLSYTTFNKLQNIESFQMNLTKTGFFPQKIIPVFSYIVITAEFLTVLMLIFYKNIGLKIAGLMFLTFTIYISLLQALGKYEVCGCGGILNGLSYKYHITINLFLIFSTLLIIKKIETNEK